jgi:lysophospholipase L1-like esterase
MENALSFSMKTVVCFGASLTAGTVSFNYLDLLGTRPSLAGFRFVNHGVNGDLAWNGLQRLDRVVVERPDYVTILIGTNDVNATMSERNLIRYRAFNHLPSEPTMVWYEDNLRTIIGRLKKETSARLAILSLAVIGEDLEHEANHKIDFYNEAIRRVAKDEDIAYLPLHERMVAHLQEHEDDRAGLPPRLAYRDGLHNTGQALALHATGLSWDEVSRRNGLLVLTDGLHLNSVGGGMIADLIEAWLIGESGVPIEPL